MRNKLSLSTTTTSTPGTLNKSNPSEKLKQMAQEHCLGILLNIWCAWKFRHVKRLQTNGKLMPKYIMNNV
jgi:hypothetical protein